ncbi:Cell division topological specificity factor, chloroplastic [Sesamum alatum]|uniref:Cell division topological specificity factor, chloroplastic n=1 Tax=Sesamum alatum TaxID=300844 RepID=A0AAE2CIZ0_9LAMI|nr:Cell division topological specificity factor, chloroplastic [Sesamum alatum]
MAVSGDFRVSAVLNPYKFNPLRSPAHFPPSKVEYNVFANGTSSVCRSVLGHKTRCPSKRPLGIFGEYKVSSNSFSQEIESFLLNTINMSFFDRLNLAWKIVFPSSTSIRNSNANIAKQRLKMILFSDRCAVSDEAKQKIVGNVVNALSDFVEIESEDKVQLSVSTDPDLGTIYSVTVPVRRVRSEYQIDDETGTITNIEYKDNGESTGSVDVKFDFYVPSDKFTDFSVVGDGDVIAPQWASGRGLGGGLVADWGERGLVAGWVLHSVALSLYSPRRGCLTRSITSSRRPTRGFQNLSAAGGNHPLKNGYIVVEVSTSKTGKHGHAKCHFVGIDIFTSKKLEDIVPSSHNCDIKDGFGEGKDLVVSVMSAMGEEQICALKDIGPK